MIILNRNFLRCSPKQSLCEPLSGGRQSTETPQPERAREGLASAFMNYEMTFTFLAKWLQLFFRTYDLVFKIRPVRRPFEKIWKTDLVKSRYGTGKYGVAAKVAATEAAFQLVSVALEIIGEDGLTKKYPVEKMFRDANTAMVSDGENNALSIVGAENLEK